jgi:superfamily II DNA/RNA helicase
MDRVSRLPPLLLLLVICVMSSALRLYRRVIPSSITAVNHFNIKSTRISSRIPFAAFSSATSSSDKLSNLSILKQKLKQLKQNKDAVITEPADTTATEETAISESNKKVINDFTKLGLLDNIVNGLADISINTPTPVQKAVIPRLLGGENIVMAASTGSGKTFAFALPAIQNMIIQEQYGYKRQVRRPRCLILVPTRELARQILTNIKSVAHTAKISSTAVLGGEQYALQKKSLDRLVDVVVASPGRLIQHKEQGNVFLSHVSTIIIDEVDTMLTQGFGPDIRAVLRSVMAKQNRDDDQKKVQLVMATATLTKAVRVLLDDISGANSFNIEFSDASNPTPKKNIDKEENKIPIHIVEVDGVHRSLPHVRHNIEETKGLDKLVVLQNVINRFSTKQYRTLIFCNTVDSCRAAEYFLTEAGIASTCYHGELNSRERESNLDLFRTGKEQYMVCTDIAARGLDIPEIDHVIMFDFPLNPVDYIHRAGRCGRAGRKGIVTALITKRDKVLSDAIQGAIARGMPIDNLTSAKKDYQDRGRLAGVVGRVERSKLKDTKRIKLTFGKGKDRASVGSSIASASASANSVGGRRSRSASSSRSRTGSAGKPGAGGDVSRERPAPRSGSGKRPTASGDGDRDRKRASPDSAERDRKGPRGGAGKRPAASGDGERERKGPRGAAKSNAGKPVNKTGARRGGR